MPEAAVARARPPARARRSAGAACSRRAPSRCPSRAPERRAARALRDPAVRPRRPALALERELGVSHVLAQVLVRRGLGDPAAARAFLDAGEAHEPSAFDGIDRAVETRSARHIARGRPDHRARRLRRRRRVRDRDHGPRAARRWARTSAGSCPSRIEDGYGLSADDRRAAGRARHCELLVTVDCGDHRRRRGRRGARRRARGRRHRPPRAARRRRAAATARSCTRRCAAIRARICAGPASPTSSRRRSARRPPRRTSSWWRWRRSPT